MSEIMKINHFHALMRKDALLTFTHIPKESRKTLEDILVIFRQKYVKPQGTASSKHKWQNLMFDPNKQSLADFLQELNDTAAKAFGSKCKEWVDALLYVKMPSHLKRSINQAKLEDASYD